MRIIVRIVYICRLYYSYKGVRETHIKQIHLILYIMILNKVFNMFQQYYSSVTVSFYNNVPKASRYKVLVKLI
jgi:hypothetical protein